MITNVYASLAGLVFLFVNSAICADELERFSSKRKVMGIGFQIVFFHNDQADSERIIEAVYQRLDQIEQRLSDYRKNSEALQLCASAPHNDFQPVSRDLWRVLSKSKEYFDKSGGSFDVTVGPYSRIWRYARSRKKMPEQKHLDRAAKSVGFDLVEFHPHQRRIRLKAEKMRLDFGGIGKGYAIDQAIQVLKARGISSALVNAGGDIRVTNRPPGKTAWRVGIKSIGKDVVTEMIELENAAVATSGDAFQYLEIDGIRYSHLLDPKTGIGVTLSSQVTVVADDAMTADAVASSTSVLGPDKGMQLVESLQNVEARIAFIPQTSTKPTIKHSSGFPAIQTATNHK